MPNMASNFYSANKAVSQWIDADNEFHLESRRAMAEDDSLFHLTEFMEVDIPEQWSAFQSSRKEDELSVAQSSILKVVSLARNVVVFNEVTKGLSFNMANDATLGSIKHYTRDLGGDDLRKFRSRLHLPFEEAVQVDEYSVSTRRSTAMRVFVRTVGLAIAQVTEVSDRTHTSVSIPSPTK